MRKVVLLLAALLVLTPVAGADIVDEIRTLDGSGNNRNHPEWGKTNTQYLRVARANYADGIAKPVGGPPTRYVSNRILQRHQPEPVLGERRHAVGLRLGAVHGPHVRSASGSWRRERTDRLQQDRPARDLHEHPGLDRVHAHAGRTRHRDGDEAEAADQHRLELHRRLQRLRRHRPTGSSGCARGRSTEGSPTTGRSCCCRTASCLAPMPAGTPQRRRRWR